MGDEISEVSQVFRGLSEDPNNWAENASIVAIFENSACEGPTYADGSVVQSCIKFAGSSEVI